MKTAGKREQCQAMLNIAEREQARPKIKAETFHKQERIVSRKQIETLFGGGMSQSMAAFPLRVVYMTQALSTDEAPVQILVSVPKKHFKHAVDRNRVKRQVREAYRLNKTTLYNALAPNEQLLIGFIWLSDQHYPTSVVGQRVISLLQRIAEKLRNSNV